MIGAQALSVVLILAASNLAGFLGWFATWLFPGCGLEGFGTAYLFHLGSSRTSSFRLWAGLPNLAADLASRLPPSTSLIYSRLNNINAQ